MNKLLLTLACIGGFAALSLEAKQCVGKRQGTCYMWEYTEGDYKVRECQGPCTAQVKHGDKTAMCTAKGGTTCKAKVRIK